MHLELRICNTEKILIKDWRCAVSNKMLLPWVHELVQCVFHLALDLACNFFLENLGEELPRLVAVVGYNSAFVVLIIEYFFWQHNTKFVITDLFYLADPGKDRLSYTTTVLNHS